MKGKKKNETGFAGAALPDMDVSLGRNEGEGASPRRGEHIGGAGEGSGGCSAGASLTDAFFWYEYSLLDEDTRSRLDELWATGEYATREDLFRMLNGIGMDCLFGVGGGFCYDEVKDDAIRYEMGWDGNESHGQRYAVDVDTEVDGCTGARLDSLLSSGMWEGTGDLFGEVVKEGTDLLFKRLYGHLTGDEGLVPVEDGIGELEKDAAVLDEILESTLEDLGPLEHIRAAEREEALRAHIGHCLDLLFRLGEKGYIEVTDVLTAFAKSLDGESEAFSERLGELRTFVKEAYIDEDPT